jgi:pimeloyl-ACP methyl ester carboxylesterase
MPAPETRYAKSGDINIAYQVLGEGPIDLVYVWGWVSHLDLQWTEPTVAGFLRRLAGFSRLIMFDKRGTGLSDPGDAAASFEQRMDDIRAVMDARSLSSRMRHSRVEFSEQPPRCWAC